MTRPDDTPAVHPSDSRADGQPPAPRVRMPDRSAVLHLSIDELIGPDHLARQVWHFVTTEMDLRALNASLKTTPGSPGRTPFARETLVALWLYATLDAQHSGRGVSRSCGDRFAYLWITGGVPVNYHTLNDFRTAHAEWLDARCARLVGLMGEEGLIDFDTEALGQDGMRVRADAGSDSFRSEERLAEMARLATERPAEGEPSGEPTDREPTDRGRAARERAIRERGERLERARREVGKVKVAKRKRERSQKKKTVARASTTDPEARRMKMGDGGTRPAYNVQFGTLLGSLVIVGMLVSNSGSDAGQVGPMLEKIGAEQGKLPEVMIADGGFSSEQNIRDAARLGVEFYSPLTRVEEQRAKGIDPYQRKRTDSEEKAAWRARMGADGAAEVYEQRGKCELPNAYCRDHGLGQFSVRGLAKVRAQVGWYVLAHNFGRLLALRAAKATGVAAA